MSKLKESKLGSPGVIARLMGLDGMPSRQDEHKVLKRKEQSNQMKSHRSSATSSRRSSRKSSRDEQEFKDVYEVLDSPRRSNGGNCLCGTSNRRPSSADMDLIQQKFMDVKRLSADEKFQDSKELDDALEVLDSNSDLFLKILEQPDFLFTKHLHDLRGATYQPHCHMLAVNVSHTSNCNNNYKNQKRERQILHKNGQQHSWKLKEFTSSDSHDKCSVHGQHKLSKFRYEEKNGPAVEPTMIIVLKPKLGRSSLNVARTVSPPYSSYPFSSDCRNRGESIGVKHHNANTRDLNRENQIWFSRHHSKDSREIAKEIIRQTRIHVKNDPMKFSNSRARGYVGDESSCEISTSDSGNDSDIPAVTSTETVMHNNQLRSSPSCSAESFVSREAKKRLSERWKLTHKSQDMNITSKNNTLGEMLSKSDKEVRLEDPSGSGECSSRYMHRNGAKFQTEPFGISSKDGWRDECLRNLSRSRSLLAPSADLRGPKTNIGPGIFKGNKYLMSKEGRKMDRSNSTKGKSVEKDYSCSRNLRSCNKEVHYCSSNVNRNSNVLVEPYEGKRNFEKDEQSEENVSVLDLSACTTADTDSGPESTATDSGNSGKAVSRPVVELSPPGFRNHTDFIFNADVTSYQGLSDGPSTSELSRHQSTSELGSQTSLKETDQPSPVSILETPYGDDLSSGSECFESLSADIHGLRMQLKLLKSESEAYEEEQMMVSSDDNDDEQSVQQPEDKWMLSTETNWELSYVADVLDSAGINDADPDTFTASWYSADCPVNPKVFEELEIKYCEHFRSQTRSRCERKLMFDRVNSMLIEMHQDYTDQLPLLMAGTRIGVKWNKQVFKASLQKLESSNAKKASENSEEVLEPKWLNWREEMDAIGREIESMLIDQLIAELKF